MKKAIAIIITIIVLSVGLVVAFNLISNKSLINKQKTIGDVVFKNAKITKKDDKYQFTITIICKSNDKADIGSFDAVIIDKKGKELDVLSGYVGGINKGETKIIEIISDKDLSSAYEINYTVYKE